MRFAHDFWIRFKALARKLSPPQLVFAGFFSYVALGVLVLSLPAAQTSQVRFVDNLFMATSAMSTTGLTTVSTADDYSWLGQLTLLVLIQLGGIGYMVVSSFVILARKQNLGPSRENVLKAQFSLPAEFSIRHFVWHVCIFTLVLEALGACVLFFEFRAQGVENALWQAAFHSISAFCTAGFSLFNDSMVRFSGNTAVCVTIMVLSYLGGIGFIVLADLWMCLRTRGRRLTFTSRVILAMTLLVFVAGSALMCTFDSLLADLPLRERLLAATFQLSQASSTAGFNSVDIGKLSEGTLLVLTVAMIIGASPAGTGGGLKTTSVSALIAMAWSTLRGRSRVTLLGHEIPVERLNTAVTNATLYLCTLAAGVYLISLFDSHDLLRQSFECASALGTVGLSMGITGELNVSSKLVLVGLMFVGRVGPLTAGLAFLQRRAFAETGQLSKGDLSV